MAVSCYLCFPPVVQDSEIGIVAEDRKFMYKCSEGHEIISPFEQKRCLAIVKGSPCKGKLVRFGPGSKTETKEKK